MKVIPFLVPDHLMFVVGGFPSSAYNKVEVVDLSDEIRTCPDIADYPGATDGSVGTVMQDQAMACGGDLGKNLVDILKNVVGKWIFLQALHLIL